MQEGLAAQRATGAEAVHPYFLALQAEIYGKMGQLEEGLAALAEASAMRQRTGEQWYEAELYRLKGTLTLRGKSQSQGQSQKSKVTDRSPTPDPRPPGGEPKTCFSQSHRNRPKAASQIAGTARGDESGAAVAESRQETEAHQMLSEIYGWFTEGFDTEDLREAKILLAKLA